MQTQPNERGCNSHIIQLNFPRHRITVKVIHRENSLIYTTEACTEQKRTTNLRNREVHGLGFHFCPWLLHSEIIIVFLLLERFLWEKIPWESCRTIPLSSTKECNFNKYFMILHLRGKPYIAEMFITHCREWEVHNHLQWSLCSLYLFIL